MRQLAVGAIAVLCAFACSDGEPNGGAGGAAGAVARAGEGGEPSEGDAGAAPSAGGRAGGRTGGVGGSTGGGQAGEEATAGTAGKGPSGGGTGGGRGGRGSGGAGSPSAGGRAAGSSGDAGEGGDDASGGTGGIGGATTGSGGAGTAGSGSVAGSVAAGASGSAGAAPCQVSADCDAASGDSPGCTEWSCEASVCVSVAPTCTDEDGDAVLSGPACACGQGDCHPSDPTKGAPVGCFTGDPATRGVGICRDGVSPCVSPETYGACSGEVTAAAEACNGQDDDCDGDTDEGFAPFTCGMGACTVTVPACVDGRVSACVPLVPVASTDGCNDVDDDCDGAVDEDCATCLHVAPNGDDAAALGSNGTAAFATVQAALDFADAHRNVATRVCVASGAACGADASFAGPPGAPLTMHDGIDLLGKYESTTWARCPGSVTRLAPQTAQGVHFPSTVQSRTVLDGFTITHQAVAGTAAVTLDGAVGVLLSNVTVVDDPGVADADGIVATNGADFTMFRCDVRPDGGTTSPVAVRATESRVSIQDSCSTLDPVTGRCELDVMFGTPACRGPAIGRVALQDSPGSRIERSFVCERGAAGASVDVSGPSEGTVVRASSVVHGADGTTAIGIRSCMGAAPWIVDNSLVTALETTVRIEDDCAAVIDSNQDLRGEAEVRSEVVVCEGAPCVIAGNAIATDAFSSNFGRDKVGIVCNGGCALVSENRVNAASGPHDRGLGLRLASTAAFVERNTIRAGIGMSGVAVSASDSRSRIENNYLYGREQRFQCPMVGCVNADPVGALTVDGGELDVHSNLLSTGEWAGSYFCFGISFAAAQVAGTFRNNSIVDRAACFAAALYVRSGSPRVFENNAVAASATLVGVPNPLGPGQVPPFIGVTPADLKDAVSSGNRTDGILKDVGTPAGAPARDFNRAPRDSTPDIGPVELP